jgi:hypothetical protein
MIVLSVLFIVMVPRTVQANVIGPVLLPGVAQLFGLLAVPATILAALCERPFVRRAGVRQQPLFHSFCANAITTLVGFLLVPIGLPAIYATGPIWPLLVVALSIWIEGVYYKKLRFMRAGGLRWSWIVWGNVASAALLTVVSVAAHAIETPFRADLVRPYWWPLLLLTCAAGVVGFLVGLRRAVGSATSDDDRGDVPAPQEQEVQQGEADLVSTAVPATTSEEWQHRYDDLELFAESLGMRTVTDDDATEPHRD